MADLIGADGRVIPCWSPRPNHYYAKSTWTEDEARQYAATGKYPDRLTELAAIRAQHQAPTPSTQPEPARA